MNDILTNIANSLGFSDEVAVDPSEAAAQGESVFRQTFTLTGLTEEKTNGFVVDLQFRNTLSEDGAQLVAVTVLGAEVAPLCSRGVSPEGRCI